MPTQIELLKKHGFQIRGNMGQHLLIDPNMQRKIVDFLSPGPQDKILEIGPGLGALTGEILKRGAAVIAVEKDPRFIPVLREELSGYGDKFKIIQADVLETDLSVILRPEAEESPKRSFAQRSSPLGSLRMTHASHSNFKVISNLPYYITAPILLKLVEAREFFSEAVLTMQKEVAQRLAAFPGTKHYGRLTLAVRYGAEVGPGFDIPKSCFAPAPEVDSSVLRLIFHSKTDLLKPREEKFLFDLIRTGFAQRRKTFLNLLCQDPRTGLGREELLAVFKSLGFSEKVRGEELLLKDFMALAAKLKKRVQRE